MYVRVPDEDKKRLLDELKHDQFYSLLIYYPIIVLLFSGLFFLASFVKGHFLFDFLERNSNLSKSQILVGLMIAVVLFTAVFMLVMFWQVYKRVKFESYLYCRICNAVDNYEDGICPVCESPLQEKAAFIAVYDKGQIKIINRFGLKACREAEIKVRTS